MHLDHTGIRCHTISFSNHGRHTLSDGLRDIATPVRLVADTIATNKSPAAATRLSNVISRSARSGTSSPQGASKSRKLRSAT